MPMHIAITPTTSTDMNLGRFGIALALSLTLSGSANSRPVVFSGRFVEVSSIQDSRSERDSSSQLALGTDIVAKVNVDHVMGGRMLGGVYSAAMRVMSLPTRSRPEPFYAVGFLTSAHAVRVVWWRYEHGDNCVPEDVQSRFRLRRDRNSKWVGCSS